MHLELYTSVYDKLKEMAAKLDSDNQSETGRVVILSQAEMAVLGEECHKVGNSLPSPPKVLGFHLIVRG